MTVRRVCLFVVSAAFAVSAHANIRSNAGDLASIIDAVDGSDNVSFAYAGISGSQSRTYGYNTKGEITGDGTKSFTLNAKGQIQTIAGIASYSYDGNGKRIKSVKGGNTEYALYDQAGHLVYTEQSTTKTDYLSLNGQTIVELKKTGTTTTPIYLHPDLLGSPRKATDASGNIAWEEHYDPYGQKLNGVNEKIGYTGHAYDSESNLTYMEARFFDPLVGRFLSTDPVYFKDQSPFTFNRYSYANNNPYRYTDPSGMFGEATVAGCAITAAAGCAPGAAVGAIIDTAIIASSAIAVVWAANEIADTVANDSGSSNASGSGSSNDSTLKPGPHAGDSIPARGPERDFTPDERDKINEIGNETGCHTCGTKDPGTKSGNFVPDHQPPTATNTGDQPQQLYPQCLSCSRTQGGQVRQHKPPPLPKTKELLR